MRAAVAEERSRIARELHDVIAHTVSVMGVQAAAAAQVLESDPRRARESLGAIEASAREAVLELRRLLDVMREPGDEPGLAPQPGLGQLDALVDQVRNTGLEVNLIRSGAGERLSPGVELATYRVLQEALTNVVRHAHATSVDIAIRQDGRRLEVEVTDDGNGRAQTRAAVGHGLIGMRERVALYGGLLETGPQLNGGWRVLARLSDEGGPR
jgi:signal transduction histidine kinase